MRNVSDRRFRENPTHVLCSKNFFFRKCWRLCNNQGKCGKTGQATDVNMIPSKRFACRITKTTDTHSEYVIIIVFPLQQLLRERASMLRYTDIACRVAIPTLQTIYHNYFMFMTQVPSVTVL